jgi:hypothetical protein
MSKNMLDPIIRALVGVPESRLGIATDFINRLNNDRGEEWGARFKAVLREGLAVPVSGTAFEHNEHGHIIIAFTGLDLTGIQEIERLEAAGYNISNYANFCLKSTAADGYDKNHRLIDGQVYKIALVPGKEIRREPYRSTTNLRKLGEKYGYGKPLGGHIPRIRESVSDKQMEEMGFVYIASLHDPIKDPDGDPSVLGAERVGPIGVGGRVGACWDGRPSNRWDDDGAFAFPMISISNI